MNKPPVNTMVKGLLSTFGFLISMLLVVSAQAAQDRAWVGADGQPVMSGTNTCVHAMRGVSFPECGGSVMVNEGDSDGDGVYDSRDQCPGTPAGSSVDTQGCTMVADSDGDGVYDNRDVCPNTPAGNSVDTSGCLVDSDGDGVTDNSDRCPNTPSGSSVDRSGCTVVVLRNIRFATDSADLKSASNAELDKVVAMIKGRGMMVKRVIVTGHTDSMGPDSYNMALSESRAAAVGRYLVNSGISADMISTQGMGETQPEADNGTREGRYQNRRVELVIQ